MKSRTELTDDAIEAMKKFEKYYDSITSANVEFIADTHNIVEMTVHAHGKVLVVKEHSDDFNKSLHEATDKMVRQLRKTKEKYSKPKGIELNSYFF